MKRKQTLKKRIVGRPLRRASAGLIASLLATRFAIAAPPAPLPQIPGYQAVQASRQTINMLEVTAYVNGKPEAFAIDTGASSSVMNEFEALKAGVKPTESGSPYGQYHYTKGQTLRIAVVDDLRVGGMDFGRGPIALFSEGRSMFSLLEKDRTATKVAGLLGADILLHYKAIINVRNRQIFFPIGANHASKLGATVASMGYTRVPLRLENGRALTVPCTLGGQSGRLLVDTGAFATFLDFNLISEMHLPTQATAMRFGDFHGQHNEASIARIQDLQMDTYHLPPQKLFVLGGTVLGEISRSAETRIFGVLGADLLAVQHGIVDLEDMSLYLK
ncbi:MAG: aspartyl protease family protein [Chthoniobacterales bacterium]|nr:aspartyl protease family protein [Chthoniobacterales bacterium]